MALKASAGINVTNIDHLVTKDKNGKKWLNVNIEVFDQPNKYGQDVGITLSQTKEERLAEKPKTYLGNGKVFGKSEGSTSRPAQSRSNDDYDPRM